MRVGPVLEANDTGRAVAQAIVELETNADVNDRGAYLRVLSPDRCVLSRAIVERLLRRPFRLPGDLELVMVSFSGKLRIDEDSAIWEAGP